MHLQQNARRLAPCFKEKEEEDGSVVVPFLKSLLSSIE